VCVSESVCVCERKRGLQMAGTCCTIDAYVLQRVAVCCSVLQCVAVCCSVLQCVAVCCSVLQCAECVAVCTCGAIDAHIKRYACISNET